LVPAAAMMKSSPSVPWIVVGMVRVPLVRAWPVG
jgi:hypothetical protein